MAVQREQVVQTAEKFVSRGKIEPAIREYRKLLAENPNDINTLNRVGDLYARIQRIDEAVDFFTQIAEQYTAEGFFVKAIAIYKKIIKLNPTRLEVYEKLAELYHKQGLITEARTQYQVLADYYQKHENAASAIAIYQKMVELEPNNPSYHVKLAEIYHQQQLVEKALGEYRIIAELMISHGHPQEAAQVYQRGLDIDSENLPFITDAVLKLKQAGHAALASQFLATAVERNPQAERVGRLAGLEDAEGRESTKVGRAFEPVAAPPEPFAAADDDAEVEEPRFAPAWGREEPEPVEAFEEDEPAVAGAPAAAAAPAPVDSEEFDLDLEDVFVLDMEDDEEPSSLVKPPPDMLGDQPRRPAWAQGTDSGVAQTAPPAPAELIEDEIEISLEPEEPAWNGPSWQEVMAEAEAVVVEDVDAEAEADVEEQAGDERSIDLGEIDLLDSLPGMSFEGFGEPRESPAAQLAPAEEPESWEPESGTWQLEEPELAAAPEPAAEEPPLSVPQEQPSGLEIDPDLLERTAAELHPETLARDEDLVTEAEVLAKYGLEEKALERLREALRLQPRHLGAYALMIQLHLDKGRHTRVLELANHMAEIAAGARDPEPWNKIRKRLLTAGFRMDGDRVAAAPQVRGTVDQGVDQLLRGILGDKPARKTPAAPRPAPVAPPAPPVPEPPAAFALQPLGEELLADLPAELPVAEPPLETGEPLPAAAETAPVPAPEVPEPPKKVIFDPLSIAELVENEDDDWLDERISRPRFSVGGGPPAPVPPAPFPPPIPALAPSPSASVAPAQSSSLDDTDGLSWLDEAERRSGKTAASGPGLFDDESDFFDLAGELEQELSQEDVFQDDDLLMPSEQSLEEIVEGFKKGVAEHLSPTDYDTHFNLGIAYREMGLLDEAIGEFQLAAKSPTHLVSCCSMLGLCFLDKGLPELAVKWYRRGLEVPNVTEEDSLGLLYDLGCAYLNVGDDAAAYKAFVDLYGINSNYRDVVARIEELGRAR